MGRILVFPFIPTSIDLNDLCRTGRSWSLKDTAVEWMVWKASQRAAKEVLTVPSDPCISFSVHQASLRLTSCQGCNRGRQGQSAPSKHRCVNAHLLWRPKLWNLFSLGFLGWCRRQAVLLCSFLACEVPPRCSSSRLLPRKTPHFRGGHGRPSHCTAEPTQTFVGMWQNELNSAHTSKGAVCPHCLSLLCLLS